MLNLLFAMFMGNAPVMKKIEVGHYAIINPLFDKVNVVVKCGMPGEYGNVLSFDIFPRTKEEFFFRTSRNTIPGNCKMSKWSIIKEKNNE